MSNGIVHTGHEVWFQGKIRIIYFNTLGIAKIGKRDYMAILINAKFMCHVHSVLILDIFM